MTTYPVGTNVREIRHFDRSIKVCFECKEHPGIHYVSKDPFASQWFPGNEAAERIEWRLDPDPCQHMLKDDVWLTAKEYNDGE